MGSGLPALGELIAQVGNVDTSCRRRTTLANGRPFAEEIHPGRSCAARWASATQAAPYMMDRSAGEPLRKIGVATAKMEALVGRARSTFYTPEASSGGDGGC